MINIILYEHFTNLKNTFNDNIWWLQKIGHSNKITEQLENVQSYRHVYIGRLSPILTLTLILTSCQGPAVDYISQWTFVLIAQAVFLLMCSQTERQTDRQSYTQCHIQATSYRAGVDDKKQVVQSRLTTGRQLHTWFHHQCRSHRCCWTCLSDPVDSVLADQQQTLHHHPACSHFPASTARQHTINCTDRHSRVNIEWHDPDAACASRDWAANLLDTWPRSHEQHRMMCRRWNGCLSRHTVGLATICVVTM